MRRALRRYVRTPPRAGSGAEVTILLGSAWGMGGTIRSALNVAGYLARRYDVEIVSVLRRREVPFFPFPPGVKVSALDDQRPTAPPPRIPAVRTVMRARASVLMPASWRPFAACSLWTDLRLARKLRGRSGALIASHPALILVAADLSPPGLVLIGNEQMHLRAHHHSVQRAMAALYPRLDALVVLTEQDAAEFRERLDPPPRITMIPNSAHEPEGPRANLSGTTILAAGRLTPQKGFDLLIEAFGRVVPGHPDWRLRICGGGRSRPALQRLIDDSGLADVITLAGPVRRLETEMDQASLFVLSSRFEGFPLVLVEAMSKGVPVVSFDCPTGPRDVIDDHRNGILVPAGDIDALAAGMRELIEDDRLRRRLGAAAAETAARYTIDAIGSRWERLIAELTASPRHRAG